MEMGSKIIFYDTETIPDLESASILLGLEGEGYSDDEVYEKIKDYHRKTSYNENEFLRQLFHRIVAISFVSCDVKYHNSFEYPKINKIESIKDIHLDEKAGLSFFLKPFVKKQNNVRIVDFNGSVFDRPVIKYRAMKYGINGGDFFNKYNYRYDQKKPNATHIDLLDMISDYRSSGSVKLAEICAILKIPCKYGIDGSMVYDVFKKGDYKMISDYCEIDALLLYIIYIRYRLSSEMIDVDLYNICIQDVIDYIENSDSENLNFFLTEWKKMNNGSIFL